MTSSPSFWNELITEKSWDHLQALRRRFQFVLIGGWAVFLYTRHLKSKDIDIVVDYGVLYQLRQVYPLAKNERLKKYEIRLDEVDVDIYVPNFSTPGLPAEVLLQEAVEREGFQVPSLEQLLIMKEYAHSQRQGSAKGEKDSLDLLSLLVTGSIEWDRYHLLAQRYAPESPARLKNFLVSLQEAVPLKLDRHRLARLKRGWLTHL